MRLEAFLTGCLDVFSHAAYIPLQGIGCKRRWKCDDRTRSDARACGIARSRGAAMIMRGHGHASRTATRGHEAVRDPVCGMTVDPATSKHRFEYRGETYHFCSAGCRTKFAADPQRYLDDRAESPLRRTPKARSTPARCIRRSARSARQLPDLRHGAGARSRQPRCAAQPRTRRHDAALLDRPCAGAAGRRAGDGRPSRRRPWPGRPDAVELDPARVRHAGGAVGGLAVLRARLAIAASRATSTCSP